MTLSGATSNPTTYAFSLAGNTATAGTDFTTRRVFSNGVTLAAGVLTVPAGVTTFTVTYPTLTDALADNGETTALSVGGVAAVGTINDTTAPTVNSVTNATATEGANLVHTVTLSGATTSPTTYAFSLADGTATAGTDYTNAPTFSNGVTLAAGVLTVPAGVTTLHRDLPDPDRCAGRRGETTALTVGGVAAIGTINDATAPTVTRSATRRATEGTNLVHTVTLERRDEQPDHLRLHAWRATPPRRAPTTPTRRPSATA